jgi:hypothetical protein
MSRSRVRMILGVLVALAPFAGLPYTSLMWILPILGIAIVIASVPTLSRVSVKEHETTPTS